MREGRQLSPNWDRRITESRLASWAPIHTIVSLSGQNRITVASSDAYTPISIATGVCEEDACIDFTVKFFTMPTVPIKEYSAVLRIDTRDINYCDSIYDAAEWWEKECGYTPAQVPEAARLPVNSLWYSYHQQLDVEDIVKECRLSKPFGMHTVIIDDGWQTDDNSRGYAYCGDWQVAKSKIPDMRDFVKRLHDEGMKVMLWYAVPYMGMYSKNYERFKTMLLKHNNKAKKYFALDPRYKEVREYIVKNYRDAMLDFDLDGLKLDFIDQFILNECSLEYDERRDIDSIEEAVDTLMLDIITELKKIKPDVMIEFRQRYIGPAIRKYGNMLRVGDCPEDAFMNRQDVINLRLTSGNTPVHSDMLMWNYEDSAENAAIQIASCLYSVPQISMKIAKLSDEHRKMLKYYLSFWMENRDVLLDGKVYAEHPDSFNTKAYSCKSGKAVYTCFTDNVISAQCDELIAVNATGSEEIILKNCAGKSYRSVNCMGEELNSGTVLKEIESIPVPRAGMVFVK